MPLAAYPDNHCWSVSFRWIAVATSLRSITNLDSISYSAGISSFCDSSSEGEEEYSVLAPEDIWLKIWTRTKMDAKAKIEMAKLQLALLKLLKKEAPTPQYEDIGQLCTEVECYWEWLEEMIQKTKEFLDGKTASTFLMDRLYGPLKDESGGNESSSD